MIRTASARMGAEMCASAAAAKRRRGGACGVRVLCMESEEVGRGECVRETYCWDSI
jgi:hypothetical protein